MENAIVQPPPPDNYPPPPPGGYYPPPPRPPRWLPKDAYTPWRSRVLAFLIDWTPIWILVSLPYVMLGIQYGMTCLAEGFAPEYGCSGEPSNLYVFVTLGGILVMAVYFFWNFCHRQGRTGQSIGKSVMKFKVINEKTWQPIGFWRSFLRQLAHYIDQAICYLGYFFPLWDDKRQTIADKIMSTVCVPVDMQQPPPRGYPQPY